MTNSKQSLSVEECPALHLTGGNHQPGYVDPCRCRYCGVGLRSRSPLEDNSNG
jgi:hypothetical protein